MSLLISYEQRMDLSGGGVFLCSSFSSWRPSIQMQKEKPFSLLLTFFPLHFRFWRVLSAHPFSVHCSSHMLCISCTWLWKLPYCFAYDSAHDSKKERPHYKKKTKAAFIGIHNLLIDSKQSIPIKMPHKRKLIFDHFYFDSFFSRWFRLYIMHECVLVC